MPETVSHGIRIHYEVTGSGPPVLLLHSFLCSGAMWAPQVAALSTRWQLINVDARGHGLSGPVTTTPSIYDLVDDAVAVLDHLGIKKVVWAGLSIGGMTAIRAAIRKPERVSGLILVDTDAGPENWFVTWKFRMLAGAVRLVGVRPMLGQICQQMFGPTTMRSRPDLVAEWKARFMQLDVPSVLNMLETVVSRDDVTDELGGIGHPTLILVGREDRSLPLRRSQAIADGMPGATFTVVEGAGHLASLEAPEAVSAAMRDFLESF